MIFKLFFNDSKTVILVRKNAL